MDICDINAVKEIHKTHSRFHKSEWYRRLVSNNFETMFTTTDPHFHASRRRLLASPISDSSLHQHEALIASRVHMTISRIAEEMQSRGAADVFKWWLFMATDIIGELSFGESFRMLEAGEVGLKQDRSRHMLTPCIQTTQYTMDLEAISGMQPIRTTFPFMVSVARHVPLPLFKKVADSGKRVGLYAQQSIDRYKRMIAEDPDAKPTLFTKLFDTEKGGLPHDEIKKEAQGYIVAGSDTTAVTLTYLIYAVSRDSRIRDKLVAEVTALTEPVLDNDLRGLPYLSMVISETLRLYTAVPFGLPRTVPSEGAHFNGYFVSGGTTVSTQSYSLHRDPAIFPAPYR